MPIKRTTSHRAMLDQLSRSGKLTPAQTTPFKKLHDDLASGAVVELSRHNGLWVEQVYYEYRAGKLPSQKVHPLKPKGG